MLLVHGQDLTTATKINKNSSKINGNNDEESLSSVWNSYLIAETITVRHGDACYKGVISEYFLFYLSSPF